MTDSEGKARIIVLLSKKVGTRTTTPITGSWRSLPPSGCSNYLAVFKKVLGFFSMCSEFLIFKHKDLNLDLFRYK